MGESLRKIDLSNNEIRFKGARELGKVISRQSEAKDEIVWAQGLRGCEVDKPPSDGLKEICVANNLLGDKGAINIVRALYHDIWLKALDIRNNEIKTLGLQEIVSTLYTNKTVLYLDIRGNEEEPPYSFSKVVLSSIANNIVDYKDSCESNYNPIYEAKIIEMYTELGSAFVENDASVSEIGQASQRSRKIARGNLSHTMSNASLQKSHLNSSRSLLNSIWNPLHSSRNPQHSSRNLQHSSRNLLHSSSQNPLRTPRTATMKPQRTPRTATKTKRKHQSARRRPANKECVECRTFERALFKSEA